jgi:hypothetical protein
MPRRLCIVIRAAAPPRIAEALRAALGLGLRGDQVRVLAPPLAPLPDGPARALALRAVATLGALGHPVETIASADDPAIAAAIRDVDAVEVWT